MFKQVNRISVLDYPFSIYNGQAPQTHPQAQAKDQIGQDSLIYWTDIKDLSVTNIESSCFGSGLEVAGESKESKDGIMRDKGSISLSKLRSLSILSLSKSLSLSYSLSLSLSNSHSNSNCEIDNKFVRERGPIRFFYVIGEIETNRN